MSVHASPDVSRDPAGGPALAAAENVAREAPRYVDDVNYVNLFHRHATPAWLHFVAGGLGFAAPDPGSPVRWCELGCGPGYGTVLAAAANPKGRFIGIDFNAAHIAHAKGLATQAGVSNVRFLERDLQSLLGGTAAGMTAGSRGASVESLAGDADFTEGFDFISVVGVYAWVSPADRQAIQQFVARFLKPGGMVYLTYSCHPGMSWFVGMQRLLSDYAATVRGSSSEQITAALRFLQELGAAQGSRLAEHPAQLVEIGRALESDPRYLAHEFMAPHWAPQHVADVIGDFAKIGCSWLGSAQAGDNIDDFQLPPALRPLLASLPAGPLRETARALATRQSMRHDIFQRAAQPMSEEVHRQALMAQRLAPVPAAAQALPGRLDARLAPDTGWGGVVATAQGALAAQGPQTFAQLSRHAAFKSRVGLLNPVFQLLAQAGVAHPMMPAAVNSRRAQAFNLAISGAVLRGEDYGWLAAPAIGSGILVEPWLMALANALLTSPALRWDALLQAVATRLDTLRALNRRGSGPVLPTSAALSGALREAMRNVVPSWRELGVIAG
jgi:SAM-dependent methyltransferase